MASPCSEKWWCNSTAKDATSKVHFLEFFHSHLHVFHCMITCLCMQKESCNSTAEEGCCQFKGVLFSLFPSLFLVHDYMFCVMYIDGFNDRRDSLRKFGYSLRGKRTQAQKLVARGHVSAICAMSLSGILECQFENGSVNHETFRNLIEKSLLPHLCHLTEPMSTVS